MILYSQHIYFKFGGRFGGREEDLEEDLVDEQKLRKIIASAKGRFLGGDFLDRERFDKVRYRKQSLPKNLTIQQVEQILKEVNACWHYGVPIVFELEKNNQPVLRIYEYRDRRAY